MYVILIDLLLYIPLHFRTFPNSMQFIERGVWKLFKSKVGKNDIIKDNSSTVYYIQITNNTVRYYYIQRNINPVLFSPSWVATPFPWAHHRYKAKARMGQGQYRTFDFDNWFRKSVQGHYTSSTHRYSIGEIWVDALKKDFKQRTFNLDLWSKKLV